MLQSRRWSQSILGAFAALAMLAITTATPGQIYLSEDFEALPLGRPVDELPDDNAYPEAWNPDGPEGWTVDRSGVPAGGVTEWRGWTFVDPVWWNSVAGQGRDVFAIDQGLVIAVADGDEWDDAVHEPGDMVSTMSTPPISVSGFDSETELFFDSSWYPDAQQVGELSVSFDGGAPQSLFRWESTDVLEDGVTPNPNYKPDAGLEQVIIPIEIPAGAADATFNFTYTGGNNWWWGIDNIEFGDFYEDFESVELLENVMEGRVTGLPYDVDNAWTPDPPEGWTSNREDVYGFDDPAVAVEEWEGWSFANKDFWVFVAGDQDRSMFTRGEGTVAIVDPDEWDDLGGPSAAGDVFDAEMQTAEFSIAGAEAGSLTLEFDSSFRPWEEMTGYVSVSYDGGPFEEVLTLITTDEFPNSDLTRVDEHVSIELDNPAGASTMALAFGLYNAGNDWWWAFDNLVVRGGGSPLLRGDFNGDGSIDATDIDALTMESAAGTNDLAYDLNGDNLVNAADVTEWITAADIANSYLGDANLDGEFSSADFVQVFQAGKYESGNPAVWSEGDWNGDGIFGSGDFVVAFQGGGYELGPKAAVSAVPEPSAVVLLVLGVAWVGRRRR